MFFRASNLDLKKFVWYFENDLHNVISGLSTESFP